MEVFGETSKLTKIINNDRLLTKTFGSDRAKRIRARIDEFDAAKTLLEIPSDPPPRCHQLNGNRKHQFAVDVSANYRLIFEGYDQNDNLSTQRDKIVTISILEIEDYH